MTMWYFVLWVVSNTFSIPCPVEKTSDPFNPNGRDFSVEMTTQACYATQTDTLVRFFGTEQEACTFYETGKGRDLDGITLDSVPMTLRPRREFNFFSLPFGN